MLTLRRYICSVALFLLLAFLCVASPVQAAAPYVPRYATAYELIDAVNAYRAQNGLPAYRVSPILMGTAQSQAEYMASIQTVTHSGPGGTSYSDRLIAAGYSAVFRSENILSASPNASGWELVTSPAWADDLHQHTMLSPNLCEVGAGVAVNGGRGYYVLDAACPSGSGGANYTPLPGVTPGGTRVFPTPVTVIPNTPKPDGSVIHIVQPGETLWSLAIAYKTTIAELKANNRLASDNIYPGDTLIIFFPKPTASPSPTSTATPAPTVTPFIFWTVTSSPEPTATPVPSAPVTGRSGAIVVGAIVAAALVIAGAFTAAGVRPRVRN